MARPNYSGEKRRKELEKQKKKEEKKRRKLEHASLPAKSEEVIEASEAAPEQGKKKDEGRIKKQSNQRPFERLRIVTKMAVSSLHSWRRLFSFAADTMPAATSSSSQ